MLKPIGNIGIGTITPSFKLEVVGESKLKGKVIIDNELIVADSANIKKKLTVDQDLIVKGPSEFDGHGRFLMAT